MLKSVLFFSLIGFGSICSTAMAQDSNRTEVLKSLTDDGYQIVLGKTFTEADWAQGASAIAASILSANAGPFIGWFSSELEQNIAKMSANLPGVGAETLRSWIVQSLDSKKIIVYNGFKIHAGVATYERWNRIVYHEPETYECRWGVPGFWTTGFCTRMVQKERRIPLLNHQQFFVRYQLAGGSNKPIAQGSYTRVYISNKCSQPIYIAANYLNLDQQWVAQGFWFLQPGQSAYVLNTRNRILEFNAVSRDGNLHWDGPSERTLYGHKYKFFTLDMLKSNYSTWTENFTCTSSAPAAVAREGNYNSSQGGELEPGQASPGTGDDWNTPGGGHGDDWKNRPAPSDDWNNVPVRYSSGLSDWNSVPDLNVTAEQDAHW